MQLLPGVHEVQGLSSDLERVDAVMSAECDAIPEPLRERASHITLIGGKRLGPTLVLVAARSTAPAGSSPDDDVVRLAAAIELLHVSSLYHDDVMDGAERRRNVESANAKWGNHVAVIAGDVLMARSFLLASTLGQPGGA